MNHNEFLFEAELFRIAPLFGCMYVKIPDAVKTRESLKQRADGSFYMKEKKRPFDAILVSKTGNYCIEAKANANKLECHQKKYGENISVINQCFYVLRVIVDTKMFKKRYQVETVKGETLLSSQKIEDLFLFFNSLTKKR